MKKDSYSNTMTEVVAYKGGHAKSQGFVLLKRNGVNFGVHRRVVDVVSMILNLRLLAKKKCMKMVLKM